MQDLSRKSSTAGGGSTSSSSGGSVSRKHSGRLRNFVKGLTSSSSGSADKRTSVDSNNEVEKEEDLGLQVEAIEAKSEKGIRRVLYTANVGDARAVLSRGGKSVRLTYDHKGSDTQEAKRILDAGGFVMNNRVNGELCRILPA